jgi:hypothetical protein
MYLKGVWIVAGSFVADNHPAALPYPSNPLIPFQVK